MNNLFKMNEISDDLIQICGKVNGFARKTNEMNRSAYVYSVHFIKDKKLVKVSNEKIRSITSKEQLKEHLEKIYCEE